jgi:hypothetical protein
MTPQETKYIFASHEQTLNTVLNLHAESRATKEMLILLASKTLSFPDGHTAASYWQSCCDKAFEQLSQDSKAALLKQIQ